MGSAAGIGGLLVNSGGVTMNRVMVLLTVFFCMNAFAATGWEEEKFPSGQVKLKVNYVAPNDIEESISYYENGRVKFTYKRVHKSKPGDARLIDIYDYKSFTDRGLPVADGKCSVSATRDFYPDRSCEYYTGVEKNYDKQSKVVAEISYDLGEYHGVSTLYEENKTIKLHYAKGIKLKAEELDPKTLKVIKSEAYFADGSIKEK